MIEKLAKCNCSEHEGVGYLGLSADVSAFMGADTERGTASDTAVAAQPLPKFKQCLSPHQQFIQWNSLGLERRCQRVDWHGHRARHSFQHGCRLAASSCSCA